MNHLSKAEGVQTHQTFCRICESLCGLTVTTEFNRVVDVVPDTAHVVSQGFSCVKGLNQHELYDSPDRLEVPLKRIGESYEEIGWPQALAEIGAKVKRLQGTHGADTIGMYVGTAAGFSVLHPVFAKGFHDGLGSRSMYSSSTQDCSNKFAVAQEMYGSPLIQPFPDLTNTSTLVIVGANPVVSKWSFLGVSNPRRRISEIIERGGQVWVVDPRRTETAKVASGHAFIRPGTDVFFYLGFLHQLLERGVDRAAIAATMNGFDEIEALVAGWDADRCSSATGVPSDVLRRIVDDFDAADGAAVYSSTGVNMGGQGALAFWLQEVINAVSGNLDRRGGTLVGKGIIDFPRLTARSGALTRSDRSRVDGVRSINDAFPGGVLADEILTPGRGQVRGMFVTGGNPLVTMPDAGRLRRAFESLDLLVAIDLVQNETASLAHYVLPAVSPYQRPDLPFTFPLLLGMQTTPFLQATRAVVSPQGEQRDESSIYLNLARACGSTLFGSRIAHAAVTLLSSKRVDGTREVDQERILDLILRLSRQGSLRRLLRERHGRLRPETAAATFLGSTRVLTPDSRVSLAPPALIEAAKVSLDAIFDRVQREDGKPAALRLITKRAVTTHNSWTHNAMAFLRRGDRNYLYMHPDDAGRRGLDEGDAVDVSSPTASVRVGVSLTSDLMPGVVALPHGWGHQHAVGLSVAGGTGGVNANLLSAGGAEALDPLSGMARLTGIAVEVAAAAHPVDHRSWSGISTRDHDRVPSSAPDEAGSVGSS